MVISDASAYHIALVSRDSGTKQSTSELQPVEGRGSVNNADIVWGDGSWIVAFAEGVLLQESHKEVIRITRLGTDGSWIGTPLDINPNVNPATSAGVGIGLSESANGLALVYNDLVDFGNNEIRFVHLSGAGVPDSSAINISNTPLYSWWPQIAWTGTSHGVVWMDLGEPDYRVKFAEVDADGSLLKTTIFAPDLRSDPDIPAFAWNAVTASYLTCWTNSDLAMEMETLYCAELDPSGEASQVIEMMTISSTEGPLLQRQVFSIDDAFLVTYRVDKKDFYTWIKKGSVFPTLSFPLIGLTDKFNGDINFGAVNINAKELGVAWNNLNTDELKFSRLKICYPN